MTRQDAEKMIEVLLPYVERETMFLTPTPTAIISAEVVFDAIRKQCEPEMTEEEFNRFADSLKPKRRIHKQCPHHL